MAKNDLPLSWIQGRIEELFAFNPKHDKEFSDDLKVSFVPMSMVDDQTGTIQSHDCKLLGEVRKGYTHFADGDVIFAKITPCMENGKSAVAQNLHNGLACGSTEFHVLRSYGGVLPEYLYSFLRQERYLQIAAGAMTGVVGQRRLPKEFLLNTEIPLPPLNEQRRIVAKIEAQKARSQQVKETLEAIPPLLDQFRQSVLAAAFRGDLTADWREKNPDVEPASVLLGRIRAERRRRWEKAELEKMKASGKKPTDDKWKSKYKEPELVDDSNLPMLPNGWCWAMTQNIGDVQLGRQRSPENHTGEYMRKYLRAANVRWNGLDLSDVKEMNFAPEDFKRFRLQSGDLLLNEASGSQFEVGKPAIWRDEISDCCIQNTLIRVRPLVPISEFLYYQFLWNAKSGTLGNASKGIGIHHLGNQLLAEWLLRLPPVEEQKEIIFRIQKLLKTADCIQQIYQEVKVYLDQLDQSILAKAFRGELVPQDPNDEPASILLERIQAERAKREAEAKATKKSTGKTTGRRTRKVQQQDSESNQLELPGLE